MPEPNKHSIFTDVFGKTLKNIDNKKTLQYLYQVHLDILKRKPTQGNAIINEIKVFIKIALKDFNVSSIEADFETIKDKSYLKIKVINIFRIGKKDININIKKYDISLISLLLISLL